MTDTGRVAILLATYNGERFLDEQISSLLAQTHADLDIIIRDDHSTDGTPAIIARWASARPDRIRVVRDGLGKLELVGNFSRLMALCDAPYFAFCDQDDVWLPLKVERLLAELRRWETRCGVLTPILVHSDLRVVDQNLCELAPSFFRHLDADLRRGRRIDRLIFNNLVTGCALIGNRALLELARPIPAGIRVHDWWVALIAASCGIVRTLPETTVLYRQHGGNVIGAGRPQRRSLWAARHILRQPRKLHVRIARAMGNVQSQARILLEVAGSRMSRRDREFLRSFCLPQMPAEIAALPWSSRNVLLARHLLTYIRTAPFALHWCY